jgi:hypothetical protein
MSSTGWNQMADWWDEKIGDEGDLWLLEISVR